MEPGTSEASFDFGAVDGLPVFAQLLVVSIVWDERTEERAEILNCCARPFTIGIDTMAHCPLCHRSYYLRRKRPGNAGSPEPKPDDFGWPL